MKLLKWTMSAQQSIPLQQFFLKKTQQRCAQSKFQMTIYRKLYIDDKQIITIIPNSSSNSNSNSKSNSNSNSNTMVGTKSRDWFGQARLAPDCNTPHFEERSQDRSTPTPPISMCHAMGESSMSGTFISYEVGLQH